MPRIIKIEPANNGRNKWTAQIGKKTRYFTQEEVDACKRDMKGL